jgi:hypothetical protein
MVCLWLCMFYHIHKAVFQVVLLLEIVNNLPMKALLSSRCF